MDDPNATKKPPLYGGDDEEISDVLAGGFVICGRRRGYKPSHSPFNYKWYSRMPRGGAEEQCETLRITQPDYIWYVLPAINKANEILDLAKFPEYPIPNGAAPFTDIALRRAEQKQSDPAPYSPPEPMW